LLVYGTTTDINSGTTYRHYCSPYSNSLAAYGTTTDINSGTTYRHYCSPYSNSLAAHAGCNR
jgi:hypothetical protein